MTVKLTPDGRNLVIVIALIPVLLAEAIVIIASFFVALAVQIVWFIGLLGPTLIAAAITGFVSGVMSRDFSPSARQETLAQKLIGWPLLLEISLTYYLGQRTLVAVQSLE